MIGIRFISFFFLVIFGNVRWVRECVVNVQNNCLGILCLIFNFDMDDLGQLQYVCKMGGKIKWTQ